TRSPDEQAATTSRATDLAILGERVMKASRWTFGPTDVRQGGTDAQYCTWSTVVCSLVYGRITLLARAQQAGPLHLSFQPMSGVFDRLRRLVCAALLLLFGGPVHAQRVETGFLDRTVTVAGQSYRYQVYVPADYLTKATWPVILFLHGAGERGADGLLQTTVGLGPAIRRDPKRFPAIVVFPQVPPDSQWVGAPAEM